MSYILDALQRADTERSRSEGAVSSEWAAQAPVPPASPKPLMPLGSLTAVGVGIALAVGAAWWGWSRPTATPPSGPIQERVLTGRPPPPSLPGAAEPVLAPQPRAPEPSRGRPPGTNTRVGQPQPGRIPEAVPSTATAGSVSAPVAALAPGTAAALKVTGVTYSDNPAHRMLIINGRVLLEGQPVEPGLILEAITPRSAVLNQGGARFNINY